MSIRRRMLTIAGAKGEQIKNLPIGSKIKFSNGMTFVLSAIDGSDVILISEYILERAPWATGDTLVEYQNADIYTITLKKYYDTLPIEDKDILIRNGFFNFCPPMLQHIEATPSEYRQKAMAHEPNAPENTPEDYWTGTTRKKKMAPGASGSSGWRQFVTYVDSAGNLPEEIIFKTGAGYDPMHKGVVAAFSVECVTRMKFESGYWMFVGESFEIPEIIL